jgi:hypothetical protein
VTLSEYGLVVLAGAPLQLAGLGLLAVAGGFVTAKGKPRVVLFVLLAVLVLESWAIGEQDEIGQIQRGWRNLVFAASWLGVPLLIAAIPILLPTSRRVVPTARAAASLLFGLAAIPVGLWFASQIGFRFLGHAP